MEAALFVSKPVYVRAVRISSANMTELAEITGGVLFSYETNKYKGEPYIRLEGNQGSIKARSGMWLCHNGHGWVAMTDHNFHKKYIPHEEEVIQEAPAVSPPEENLDSEVERIRKKFGW